jgi:hypothetical protein
MRKRPTIALAVAAAVTTGTVGVGTSPSAAPGWVDAAHDAVRLL